MAVELTEMGQEVAYIDIDVAKIPYRFSVKLADKTYTFTFKWNAQGQFFTADLETTSGEILAYGDIVRYGRQLFGSIEDDRFPRQAIVPLSFEDKVEVVTFENFGKSVKLYLFER
jgi:hypothetical protein